MISGFLNDKDSAKISWLGYGLLLLLACIMALPGLSTLPPIDRDEPRFAQASKQMITSGNYGDIYFQDEPRYKKPIGIYWLQSISAKIFGAPPYDEIWPFRLPSLFGVMLAVLATAWGVSRIDGARAGMLAGTFLLCSTLVMIEARLAKTDAALLAVISFTQFILARAYCSKEKLPSHLALGFWLAQGIGILIKGPIAPFVSLCTLATLWIADRNIAWARQLRPLQGIALCLAIILPWLLWIGFASGGQFYGESVGHDFLGKILAGQDRGFLPPGYHLLLFPVFFGSFACLALRGFATAWRNRGEKVTRFILAWIVPVWIVNEMIFTKLPHYVLPCYPALAWGAARLATGAWSLPQMPAQKFWQSVNILCGGVMLVGAVGLAAAPFVLEIPWTWPMFALPAIAVVLIILQIRWQWQKTDRAILCGIGSMTAMVLTGFGLLAPNLAPILISTQAAARYHAWQPCPLSQLVTSGYSEPSMVFLAGTHTVFANGSAWAAQLLSRNSCMLAMIEKHQDADFKAAIAAEGSSVIKLGEIRGYNYNGGGWRNFSFYLPYHVLPPL